MWTITSCYKHHTCFDAISFIPLAFYLYSHKCTFIPFNFKDIFHVPCELHFAYFQLNFQRLLKFIHDSILGYWIIYWILIVEYWTLNISMWQRHKSSFCLNFKWDRSNCKTVNEAQSYIMIDWFAFNQLLHTAISPLKFQLNEHQLSFFFKYFSSSLIHLFKYYIKIIASLALIRFSSSLRGK